MNIAKSEQPVRVIAKTCGCIIIIIIIIIILCRDSINSVWI